VLFRSVVERAMSIAAEAYLANPENINLFETTEPGATNLLEADPVGTIHSAHSIVSNRKRHKQSFGPTSHTRSTAVTHKKRQQSLNTLGNERQSVLEGLQIWDSVMDQSPMMNPLERRLLRIICMKCMLPESINDLRHFPIENYHLPQLSRLWQVIVSSLRQSNFEFKSYIRPKQSQVLKKQLENMVSMARISIPVIRNAPVRSIISTLKNAVVQLPPENVSPPRILFRQHTVVTETRTTTSIDIQPPLDPVFYDDFTADENANNNIYPPENIESQDDIIIRIVQLEVSNIGRYRIRWTSHVEPAYASVVLSRADLAPMTAIQLKNRYYYALSQSHAVHSNEINNDNYDLSDEFNEGNDESKQATEREIGGVNEEFNDDGRNEEDQDNANTSADFNYSGNENFRPAFIDNHNMPSLDVITATIIPNAQRGDRYTSLELELYNFMLETPSEKSKFCSGRNTINWHSFARRWLYWTKVSAAQGITEIKGWTQSQLQQKLKDMNKKKHLTT